MSSLYCCRDYPSSFSPFHPGNSRPDPVLSDSTPTGSPAIRQSPPCEQHPPRKNPPSTSPPSQTPEETNGSHRQQSPKNYRPLPVPPDTRPAPYHQFQPAPCH